ncbi:hypothetical protein [Harryflintia acetispora]|uniref:hypothetical protein n=1 Tax=Harryflintia acetispora TaxID=1849041 RepID=UPI001899DE97|nr:hypothetical protein [Harryflintia acetispora]
MMSRAVRLRRLLTASLTAGMFLFTASAGAAQSGITVTVQDNYQADYGVTIPFTRSPRTTDYTFSLYEGGSAAGTPAVSAKVEMTAAQEDVYLPLAYDITGPQSYTLKIEARPLADRIGTDMAAAREFPFTTKPTCGCAAGTAGAFYRGNGSAADPFYVGSQQQLAHVGAHNGGQFKQARDVDLAGNPWTSLSSDGIVYDGGGHRIKNLKTDGGVGDAGLWVLLSNSTVKNLAIVGGEVRGSIIGGLAGKASSSTVQGCYTDVSMVSNVDNVYGHAISGGLIGASYGTVVEDCYALGKQSVTTAPYANYQGGIIGYTQNDSAISRCYFAGILSAGNARYLGGTLGVQDRRFGFSGDRIGSCYWLVGTAYGIGTYMPPTGALGDPFNSGTQGLGAAQLASASSFSSWNFENVWRMDSGAGRPVLRVFDNPKDS